MARAGLTIDRLTQAGAELSDEVGFSSITASALARRFDVKVASLYSHFKNTHELQTRIALLALDELADRVSDASAGRAGKDALVAVANAYLEYSREHPGRYAATQFPLDHETALASGGRRQSRILRAILRGYHLNETNQIHAVRLLGSLFHGFASLDAAGSFAHSEPDAQTSWMHILDGTHHLLLSWRQEL